MVTFVQIYYSIVIFILGSCFGSFYNVAGYRIPRNMSIVSPPSHCQSCHHRLGIFDLFPIFSYIILKGRCRYCKAKVGLFYPIFEIITGLLFVVCYLLYGFTLEMLISITFISLLLIIIISDYQTMIIPDSILIVLGSILLIEIVIQVGVIQAGLKLLDGMIALGVMLLIKLFGDFLFKRESMGGGDIKLMFILGLVLGWTSAVLSIFFASFIALPVALILYRKKENHEIPFGPFLSIAAIIILLSGVDMNFIIDLLSM